MSLFLAADACLRWSLPCIYYRAASLPSQASYAVMAEESQVFFKCSPHSNSISNSAILRNNCISLLSDLCACVHVKKNGVVKEAIVLQWAIQIASCDFKMLFCAKTIVKESSKFELARLKKKRKKKKKKKKKEKRFGRLVTFWFGTFAMLFSTTGCVFRHENTRRWTVGCYNGS